MVPWLVSWAADAILKYRVKGSGKTAYEATTGHKVKHVVAAFGDSVQFRVATDPTTKTITTASGKTATLPGSATDRRSAW